jgi:hypothetical protein
VLEIILHFIGAIVSITLVARFKAFACPNAKIVGSNPLKTYMLGCVYPMFVLLFMSPPPPPCVRRITSLTVPVTEPIFSCAGLLIFGPRRDEVTGAWRTLHNYELH